MNIKSSGSVSDDELSRAWCELDIVKKSGGNLYYASWDQICEEPVKITTPKFKGARTKSGGTDLNSSLIKAHETLGKNKYDLFVIFTDGYIPPITTKPLRPTIIIITSGGNMDIETNGYPMKIIQIND